MGCVLETKKRYAGWMFESETDDGQLDSKGIETIRRDTCPIVAKVCLRKEDQHPVADVGQEPGVDLHPTMECSEPVP